MRRSSQIHFRFNVHPRPELAIAIFARVKNDLYGDPLNDFHVVTRSILRWQQAEDGPGCSRNAVHMLRDKFDR